MTLGSRIAGYRKELGITQEALANKLEVSNQAVSKWESDQCCPDVMLFPQIADIFGISLDELFGREGKKETVKTVVRDLPWEDDGVLRAVLYIGRRLVKESPEAKEITFTYEGPALDVDSAFTVNCNDVEGSVDAGGNVACQNVGGDVDAGGSVACQNVEGSVDAGRDVGCGNVTGDVDAGVNVSCGNVEGNVDAGSYVECGSVGGDVDAGGKVTIGK